MNEDQLYAVIGRKQAAFETMHAEYKNLLSAFNDVITGKTDKESVSIDLDQLSWKLKE